VITAVLDTNVLASGVAGSLLPESIPGGLVCAWRAGAFSLVVSEHILSELTRTLATPYFRTRLSLGQVARAQRLLRRRATIVSLTAQVTGVATHPEDDLVLATAVSGKAQYLVTGDRKLQELGSYEGVRIVSPRAFLDILQAVRNEEA
jgi:putative PIN family toxin of toxin-antitoxin system